MNIISTISQELQIKDFQVNAVISLFDEGATIPFIARYRKEHTGGLDEEVLREIEERKNYLDVLIARKATILKSIEEQGKLTPELKQKIEATLMLNELEDLYLPYKPKRKTRGTVAKAKGLEPLALFLLENPNFDGNFDEKLTEFINEELGVASIEEALQGAKDIIAEMISETAEVRQVVREELMEKSLVVSSKAKTKPEDIPAGKKDVYDVYHEFQIDIKHIKPYQILALNRGEKERFLKVTLGFEKEDITYLIHKEYFKSNESVFNDIFEELVADSFDRLIYPSIEREVRSALAESAEEHAIEVFASNLRQLLLQPPVSGKMILGIDPGFVSGSKVAVIDPTGKYVAGTTVYPHPPQKRIEEAKKIISDFVTKHKVDLIAIGNGTASRETEQMVAELIKENNLDCHYLIVSEAGASVYSASKIAKEEFPDLEASQRGNISIARRVLDPLAELVKIDAKSIGVGLYQHDVNQRVLQKNLDAVVESCVNYVGVDVNTASASLLTYVSGLNKSLANRIVKVRDEKGKFVSRHDFLDVPGMGEKLFEQAAGFLKIAQAENPLDNTFIHPESYSATEKLFKLCGADINDFRNSYARIKLYISQNNLGKVAEQIGVGIPTLEDIIENIQKPGRDPRDEMQKPILRSDILSIDDLSEGMKLKGTVRNVVDFGAFVDIGLKSDGLVHVSQMANRFVKNPLDIVKVGDIIDVTIMTIDKAKGRIGLSMKE
ncbi:MAG: RNA-binding transcriptional accessory protein [Melioribacteraceae bacterium]|nr:RNA-binding transcriptional accessory protein [Melioribacteraceae bacterium]